MPILIALGVAALLVTVILTVVAHGERRLETASLPTTASGVVEEVHRHPALRRFVVDRRDRTKATGLLLTIALAAITGLALAVGLVLEMVQTHEGFARWDDSAARWGAEHTSGVGESILKAITQLGSTPVVLAVCLGVALVEYRRIPTKAIPAFLATVALSQLAITNLLKVLVGRERPDLGRLVTASGLSFPSGHTAAAAAVYAAVALVLGRRRGHRTKVALAGMAVVITITVALSRVLLGAHWVTDVIAGAALGWATFALWSIAYGGRLLQFGAPVERAGAILATESPPVAQSPTTQSPTTQSQTTGSPS